MIFRGNHLVFCYQREGSSSMKNSSWKRTFPFEGWPRFRRCTPENWKSPFWIVKHIFKMVDFPASRVGFLGSKMCLFSGNLLLMFHQHKSSNLKRNHLNSQPQWICNLLYVKGAGKPPKKIHETFQSKNVSWAGISPETCVEWRLQCYLPDSPKSFCKWTIWDFFLGKSLEGSAKAEHSSVLEMYIYILVGGSNPFEK